MASNDQEQRRMFYSQFLSNSPPFVMMNYAIVLLFVAIRFYELIALASYHHLPSNMFGLFMAGLFYDGLYLFNIFLALSIIYFLISLKNNYWAFRIHKVLITVVVLTQLVLTKYFSQTFIPLGADLYGYTFTDIQKTVQTSASSSAIVALLGVVFLILFIWFLPRFVRDFSLHKLSINIFIFLCLFSAPLTILIHPMAQDYEHETHFYLVSNKTDYFIVKSYKHFSEKTSTYDKGTVFSFPLMKNANYHDELGTYFNLSEKKPNLVFLIVEGLGSIMVKEGTYEGFTPYLDELIGKSLYWKNFLSLSGRTFGVLPSLFASLPYGEMGFMEMQEEMPDHLSLISLLKKNGYTTRFLHGGDINFDRRRSFLVRQGMDLMMGQEFFGPEYEKAAADEGGFTWGYPDHALFKKALEITSKENKEPYLDIYLTLTTHEPFIPPFKDKYMGQYYDILGKLKKPSGLMEIYKKYPNEFATFLYTDEAIKNFMKAYEKRPDFKNTIFFITGDHRMIPIPHDTKLERFHVPFIIYSPLLKEAKTFLSISSHLDVTPTVLAMLKDRYNMNFPPTVHWLGDGIDMSSEFRSKKDIPFMRTKNELNDYLSGKYFLSGDQLFLIKPNMELEDLDDNSIRRKLNKKLDEFKMINRYVCENNRIMPNGNNKVLTKKVEFGKSEKDDIEMNVDALFDLARKRAFEGNRAEAVEICKKVINKYPNHHDFRALMARALAWDKKYNEARAVFGELIKIAPAYSDGYAGLAQVEHWSGNNEKAMELVNKAIELAPTNGETLMIKARILWAMKEQDESQRVVEEVLHNNPRMKDALDFKKRFEKNE